MTEKTSLDLLINAISSNSLSLISLGIAACSLAISYSAHLKSERSKTTSQRASVEKTIGETRFQLAAATGKMESIRIRVKITNREINRLTELLPDALSTSEIIEIKRDLESLSSNADDFAEFDKSIRESLDNLSQRIDDPATLVTAHSIHATTLEVIAGITGEDWFLLLEKLEESIKTIKKDKKTT